MGSPTGMVVGGMIGEQAEIHLGINRPKFAGVSGGNCPITSLPSPAYNCVAWALGFDDQFWWPVPWAGGGQWPVHLARRDDIATFVELFRHFGFFPCLSTRLAHGSELIALYGLPLNESFLVPNLPTLSQTDLLGFQFRHVARQLPSGVWTSKLGLSFDMEHPDPVSLEGAAYGRVVLYMARART